MSQMAPGQVFITDTTSGAFPLCLLPQERTYACSRFNMGKCSTNRIIPMKRRRPVLRNSADYERAENSSRPLAEVIQHF